MHSITEIKNMLCNSKIVKFGRSCDLLWFAFENDNYVYYVHSQCWVRIFVGDSILTTSNYIFEPEKESIDNFSWEKFGLSKYDCTLSMFDQLIGSLFLDITMNVLGDVEIQLSNDIKIQLLVSTSDDRESWRIFRKGAKFHYVYNGKL